MHSSKCMHSLIFESNSSLSHTHTGMEQLVELSEQEVHIDFQLNQKCRANVRLKSLSPTTPIAFKVQTSSPRKFLVSPPNGLIPPLSYATFQIILKPQTQLPPSFPRSPADRFLIKTAEFQSSFDSNQPIQSEFINSWFNSQARLSTSNLKLKVAYVGVFLLRHAIATSDVNAVKSIIKRQKSIVTAFSQVELESLAQLVTDSNSSNKVINLLSEAGLKINDGVKLDKGSVVDNTKCLSTDFAEFHMAAAPNRDDDVARWIKESFNNSESMGRAKSVYSADMLTGAADMHSKNNNCGRMAFEAASMISVDNNCPAAMGARRDKRKEEVNKLFEQGELVLTTARRGEVENLEQLLKGGANANHEDQYGLTALHAAAIKGHSDAVSVLLEYGMDIECHDIEGNTPLHLAVEGENFDTVKLLVKKGANVNTTNKKGATPIYMARAMGYDNISEFLFNRGASSSSLSSVSSLLSM